MLRIFFRLEKRVVCINELMIIVKFSLICLIVYIFNLKKYGRRFILNIVIGFYECINVLISL